MTLQETGMALAVLLGMNLAVWLWVGWVGFNVLLVGVALLFTGLSAAFASRILTL